MPIRPENRDRYPADWRAISDAIRFGRAKGRCECTGQCWPAGKTDTHLEPDGRCGAVHGVPIRGNRNRSPVVLTTAHLNHEPEDCRQENLLAMCQGCHLRYDAEHHAETRRAAAPDPAGLMLF